MLYYNFINNLFKKLLLAAVLSLAVLGSACGNLSSYFPKTTIASKSLRDVPAQRLNYNFEADVPLPNIADDNPPPEKFGAVQGDFDLRRPTDILERTMFSPDKQRVLAIYKKISDTEAGAFRLDIYSPEGKFLQQVTPSNLSLVFPSAISWSPDSQNIAFAGVSRKNIAPEEIVQNAPTPPELPEIPAGDANSANLNGANTSTVPNPEINTPNFNADRSPIPSQNVPFVLAFGTEQIYLATRDGKGLKPLTQKEGLIYFHFVWSPDSTALAALACRMEEWNVRSLEFPNKLGRPRIVEKNGRERLLDDTLTDVFPVWSPDSVKVAIGFGTDLRIYDAVIESPTSASIPLRVPLFTSSQIFDENVRRQQQGNANVAANTNVVSNANSNAAANANINISTQMPISLNPIVKMVWAEEKVLFFQTGYVRNLSDGSGSTRSYMRWHRLDLSPQAVTLK